ncbi:MAG: hypothetical protein K9I82_09815 [Chitinophagaceae bacterium]|nr:hypothetical protein [Chitinophagaceae bacterium]
MFFRNTSQKKEAILIIDIAQEYLKNMSDVVPVYSEEDKRFIWNLYSLEQYFNISEYWNGKNGQPSMNDIYIQNILEYLTTQKNQLQMLSQEKVQLVVELLNRARI